MKDERMMDSDFLVFTHLVIGSWQQSKGQRSSRLLFAFDQLDAEEW